MEAINVISQCGKQQFAQRWMRMHNTGKVAAGHAGGYDHGCLGNKVGCVATHDMATENAATVAIADQFQQSAAMPFGKCFSIGGIGHLASHGLRI